MTNTYYSKNAKLNKVLNMIETDLRGSMGTSEIKRYMKDFRNEPDYNIAQYGNMLIYYDDVYNLYKLAGYKSMDKFSTTKIWETYKRQVGYVARRITHFIILG